MGDELADIEAFLRDMHEALAYALTDHSLTIVQDLASKLTAIDSVVRPIASAILRHVAFSARIDET